MFWMYAVFVTLVLMLLALDLGVFHRKAHVVTVKEALGWSASNVRKHDDFIALRDFPAHWIDLEITVEVEAKAKEVAIAKLQRALQPPSTQTAELTYF